MKLDNTAREVIVVGLWTAVIMTILAIIIVFLKSTISWVLVKLIIVAVALAVTARWFMETKEDK